MTWTDFGVGAFVFGMFASIVFGACAAFYTGVIEYLWFCLPIILFLS